MAKKNSQEELDIDLVRSRLKQIDEKVKLLAEKVEENNERTKIYKNVNSTSTTIRKSPPLPGEIEVPKKDKYYTSPTNNITTNALGNYSKFSSNMASSVLKSKMFWILLVTLPLIFMFIEYIFYCQVHNPGDVVVVNDVKLAYDFMTNAVISPMLITGLIIFPTFIGQSRENNLLKRFGLIGMSRKQFYYFYMTFTTVFMLVFAIAWFGPILFLMNQLVGQLFTDSTTVIPQDDIYELFNSVNIIKFSVIALIAVIAMNSMGYKKAMSVKSSTSLMGWGIGLWIFSLMASGFSIFLAFNLWKVPLVQSNVAANVIVTVLLFVIKWMFIFSLPSMLSFALMQSQSDMWQTLNDSFTLYPGTNIPNGNTPPENFLTETQFNHLLLAISVVILIVSLWTILSVWFNKSKIVSFEATR